MHQIAPETSSLQENMHQNSVVEDVPAVSPELRARIPLGPMLLVVVRCREAEDAAEDVGIRSGFRLVTVRAQQTRRLNAPRAAVHQRSVRQPASKAMVT
mmetsp:Transcript_25120/g.49192  ORF Transcript_25120/g.49192 Transcript_25120/m.49192 type:complete len:99 (+) Transcript_25120:267-563(+)